MQTYSEDNKIAQAKKILGILALIIATVTVSRILIDNSSKIEGEKYYVGKFISYKSNDLFLFGREYISVQLDNTVEEISVKTAQERFVAVNLKIGESICLHKSNFSELQIVKNEQCKR